MKRLMLKPLSAGNAMVALWRQLRNVEVGELDDSREIKQGNELDKADKDEHWPSKGAVWRFEKVQYSRFSPSVGTSMDVNGTIRGFVPGVVGEEMVNGMLLGLNQKNALFGHLHLHTTFTDEHFYFRLILKRIFDTILS